MITLSADQAAAVRAVCCWFRHGIDTQQVFFLSGYAGTGKSTTLAYAIAELGLAPDQIVYGCFTMKAALVLRRNGLPASTIHRAIYVPSDPSAAGYETALQQFEALQQGRPSGMPVTLWRRRLCDLERQLADIRSVKFVLNDKSPVRDCRLVVLDEVSMVNEEMADDVLAFGKPVLVLGDPAQLPPIKGASPFAARTPDVMLTEIHRQAAESPIIYLATLARRGERIPFGSFGSTAHKLRADARGPEDLLAASQVICGKHVTRRRLNNEIKAAAGYPAALPEGRGEKLIGLKNMHEIGLFNGQFLEVTGLAGGNDIAFRADITTEDGDYIEGQRIYTGHFEDHVVFDRNREARDFFEKRDLVELDWGYAITCHKAQGSGFDNVVVVDDGFGFWDRRLRARWTYTAITRASDTLIILAEG
jgi:exodeoxyribonuclease V